MNSGAYTLLISHTRISKRSLIARMKLSESATACRFSSLNTSASKIGSPNSGTDNKRSSFCCPYDCKISCKEPLRASPLISVPISVALSTISREESTISSFRLGILLSETSKGPTVSSGNWKRNKPVDSKDSLEASLPFTRTSVILLKPRPAIPITAPLL